MKKRFSEEQIIGFLREAEGGLPVKDLCRRHGFSEASYYLWRSRFGGMSVSDAKRLKDLEAENARLKKLLAEQIFENDVIKDVLRKSLDRAGKAIAGAANGRSELERAACLAGRPEERECAPLRTATGSQRRVAAADRDAGAPAQALRSRDDPPETATGGQVREL